VLFRSRKESNGPGDSGSKRQKTDEQLSLLKDLAPEIQACIIDWLEKDDLVALRSTSRFFYDFLDFRLHLSLEINENCFVNPANMDKLFSKIMDKSKVLKLACVAELLSEPLGFTTLPHLPNLKVLRLRNVPVPSIPNSKSNIAGFFQLLNKNFPKLQQLEVINLQISIEDYSTLSELPKSLVSLDLFTKEHFPSEFAIHIPKELTHLGCRINPGEKWSFPEKLVSLFLFPSIITLSNVEQFPSTLTSLNLSETLFNTTPDHRESVHLPTSLRNLQLPSLTGSVNFNFPELKNLLSLEVQDPRTADVKKLPPGLKKLVMKETLDIRNHELPFPIPESLQSIELRISTSVDLGKLPRTLKHLLLNCCGSPITINTLLNLPNLTSLHLFDFGEVEYAALGILPTSLKELHLMPMLKYVLDWDDIQHLTELEDVRIVNFASVNNISNYKLKKLDVHLENEDMDLSILPESLQILKVSVMEPNIELYQELTELLMARREEGINLKIYYAEYPQSHRRIECDE